MTKKKFSKYPEIMNNYFIENELIIKIIPQEFLPNLERKLKNKTIRNADEYVEFLISEIEFWETYDKNNKLSSFSKLSALRKAKQLFDNAFEYGEGNSVQCINCLQNSVNALSSGITYSKTSLAHFLLDNINEDTHFFRGLRAGLLQNKNESWYSSISDFEGLNAALVFRKVSSEIFKFSISTI